MKIRSVTLHGFKSFADRTEVELHEGITAVVGPNGCGKSNISDAVRWVLGEQRPTAIRGSRMEEAIFEGTVERKPIHRAEVEMVLSNEDGTLPVPYRDVSIGRTVFRGGESEYRLNGNVCRLRDVQDLCRDTGLGANAYAIIENRMIDSILSDRAEERRGMFEEAAEIGRYKDRRRTALRRLDQARDDLERLEDVLGEVRTKVRSLAQQRGRAERYEEYRARRLELEVAVADARLERIESELQEKQARLDELGSRAPADEAELSRRETEAERLRVEIGEGEQRRAELARRLDAVRDRLEEQERRRLVARERAAAARDRLEAVGGEIEGLEARIRELREAETEAGERAEEERAAVRELRTRREELAGGVEERRARRDRAKEAEEEALSRYREAARELDQIRAGREAEEERRAARRRELERRRRELEEARARGARQTEELEEARSRLEEAGRRRDAAEDRLQRAREALKERRGAVEAARRALSEVEGELATERERAQGLAALAESGDEHPEAVGALLAEGPAPDAVLGVLADFLEVAPEWARAVEAELGGYLHGVLVRDRAAVEAVRRWLARRDENGLLLLPVDPGPAEPAEVSPADGGLLGHVDAREPAAPWVRALLAGVGADRELSFSGEGGASVAPDGSARDRWGAVRLGSPAAGRGILRRRKELERVRERAASLERRRDGLREELETAEAELEEGSAEVRRAEEERDEAARRVRETEGEREAAARRLERVRQEQAELEERIGELEAGATDDGGSPDPERRMAELREGVDEAEAEAAEARKRRAAAEDALDEAAEALRDVDVRAARREADLRAAEDRLEGARTSRREAVERREALEEERAEKRAVIEEARAATEESDESLGALLDRRDELEKELSTLESRVEAQRAELEERESWLREARKAERELSERRHGLELEIAELRARRTSIHERLEQEWERPLEELRDEVEPPEEGGPAAWSEELESVRRKLARLGPVNLLAAQEYDEEKERLDFLETQREDLEQARNDLRESIRRINREAAAAFEETFEEIRDNFQRTFRTLFEGGDCDLWLEDPEDPLDSPIEISASPRGKRTQRIHLLSGGERALTALSLLFGIYFVKPSPFCILDEVDAPLDETNVGRFTAMLDRFKDETQFIVITHNPRTIASADWIYGVTMQEPGVSSIVGVDLADLPAEVA